MIVISISLKEFDMCMPIGIDNATCTDDCRICHDDRFGEGYYCKSRNRPYDRNCDGVTVRVGFEPNRFPEGTNYYHNNFS